MVRRGLKADALREKKELESTLTGRSGTPSCADGQAPAHMTCGILTMIVGSRLTISSLLEGGRTLKSSNTLIAMRFVAR